MNTSIRKFLAEEDGITALEYGILAALVAVILVAVIGRDENKGLGKILKDLFDSVATEVSGTTTG
jgi:pilus assembly protein Flp/PilA